MRIRVLLPACLATVLAAFNGSVLWLALPAVAADFRAPVAVLTELGSVLQLGTLGALPLAALADRAGRRRPLAIAVAGCSASALASALAPSLEVLAAARVAAVGFETLAAGLATAMVVEETEAGHRALAVSALTFAAGAGIAVTTLAYPLLAPHWRWLYGGAAALLPLAALIWWAMPESRAFARSAAPGAARALLAAPYRRRLAILGLYFVLTMAALTPAQLFVVLLGSRTLQMGPAELSEVVVVAGIGGVACFALGGWAADRYGRKGPGTLLSAATGVFCGLTFLAATRTEYWAGNIGWSALASAGAPVLGAWFAELFPTRARATSEACFAVAGAAGAVAGLQALGVLEPRFGLGPVLAGGAGMAAVAAGLLLVLPETLGRPLPE